MITSLPDGGHKVTCDICGREQDITVDTIPDGWTIFLDRGYVVNVCYDPDCKKEINHILSGVYIPKACRAHR